MLYAIFTFIILLLLVGSGLLLLFYREALGQRISAILGTRAVAGLPGVSRLREATLSLSNIAGSIQRLVPKDEKEISATNKRLVRAGFRGENAVNVLYAARTVVPVVLCVAVTASGAYHWSPAIVFVTSVVLGYLLPDFVLDHMIRARNENIRLGLPDVLDLLVVCLEAGLSMDQAVLRAANELHAAFPVMADELGLVMLEIRAGRPRADVWRGFAERTDLDVIRMLVSILVQADQFGTGVSKTLRIHSETLRTLRRQRVEELAAKTTVKLVFPLLLFIFPSLWVVVLGPAAITIMENLK